MRTSQICPTCTTYINSLCVVYNGVYLSNINASPLNPLDTILANINTAIGIINSSVASINTSVTTINGNVALKENSSNKSTDGTFNAGVPSATLFPTQSAVATYVASIPSSGWALTGNAGTTAGTNFIGTTDTQDVVFKANSVEYFKLSVVDQVLVLSKSLTCNSSSTSEIAVRSTAIPTNGFVAINQNSTDKGNVQISNGDGTTKIKTLASALTRVVSFPDADGTLALTSDIVAPYKSYVAIVSYDGSAFTQVVLKNDFGSTVFTWSSPSISVFRITPSVTSFTVGKTVVFVNSYENNYLVTPKRAFNPSLDYVNLTHIKYDGTSNTMVAGEFFIEIRVYP